MHTGHPILYIADVTGIFVVVGSWVGFIPPVVAVFAGLYYVAALYDSRLRKDICAWIGSKIKSTPMN